MFVTETQKTSDSSECVHATKYNKAEVKGYFFIDCMHS